MEDVLHEESIDCIILATAVVISQEVSAQYFTQTHSRGFIHRAYVGQETCGGLEMMTMTIWFGFKYGVIE